MHDRQITNRDLGTTATFPPEMAALVPFLARSLTMLDDDEVVVIDVGDDERYVQYLAAHGVLRAESVSNRYILEGPPLTDDDLAWLDGHGWNPPEATGWVGNHWRDWARAEATEAALAGLVTLHRIHGANGPDDLGIHSTNERLLASTDARVPRIDRWRH